MIVVFDTDPRLCAAITKTLGRADASTAASAAELDTLLQTNRDQITAVIVGPNSGTSEALGIASRMQLDAPEIGVILVEKRASSDVLQAALRAGVRDVLSSPPDAKALADAVSRAETVAAALRGRSNGSTSGGAPKAGRIVTVFSPKGGVGKSVVATNLAVLLAQRGERVVAVDLDLQFGDLAILFQVFPSRTIYDAANHAGEVDGATMLEYCSPHRSGVMLLPAPMEPGLAENVSAERAQAIIVALRAAGYTVVIDTPPWFTDHVLGALDVSDEMVIVATMDVPSIKNLKVALQTLEMLGHSREKLKLVLNRADSKVGLSIEDVQRALGTNVDVSIPSSREVPLSVNRGEPLATADPGSPVTASLAKLAALIDSGTKSKAAAAAGQRKVRFGRRVR